METILKVLLHSQVQSQVFHFQTDLYSQHVALEKYYTALIPLVDELVESWQGKYGIMEFDSIDHIIQYENAETVLEYFENLKDILTDLRKNIAETYIQSRLDDIEELIYKTIYLLENLS